MRFDRFLVNLDLEQDKQNKDYRDKIVALLTPIDNITLYFITDSNPSPGEEKSGWLLRFLKTRKSTAENF
jgi:hypothetical protein